MPHIYLTEILFPSLAAAAILIYHLYYYLVKKFPMQTAIGITRHLRALWVETVMEQERDILAVQTLRNWVMASSFFGFHGNFNQSRHSWLLFPAQAYV